MDSDYWTVNRVTATWRDWRAHPTLSVVVHVVTSGVLFLLGYVVVVSEAASDPDRIATGLAALGIYWGIVVVFFLLWALLVTPARQRNDALERVDELETEATERETPQFHLELACQPHVGPISIGPQGRETYDENQTLWVAVHNDGPDARFSAHIRNAVGTGDVQYDVDEVAWEHSVDRYYEITRGSRARLRVANVAHQPSVLWFWTARSATWSPEGHAAGHRRTGFDTTIEFDLIVATSPAGKSLTKRLRVSLDDVMRVVGFAPAEPRNFVSGDVQEASSARTTIR